MRKRIPGNWVGAGPCHSYGPEGGESRCEWHLGAEVTHPTSGWAGPGRQEHESWAERGTGGGWRGAASCQRPGGEAGPPRGPLGAARGGAGGGEAGAQGGGAVCRMAYPGHPGAGGGGYYPGGVSAACTSSRPGRDPWAWGVHTWRLSHGGSSTPPPCPPPRPGPPLSGL